MSVLYNLLLIDFSVHVVWYCVGSVVWSGREVYVFPLCFLFSKLYPVGSKWYRVCSLSTPQVWSL